MVDRATLSVSFIDAKNQSVQQVELPVPTGGQGYDQRLTIACHDYAADHGYSHWVQPYTYQSAPMMDPVTEWLVFRVTDLGGRKRDFVTRKPTREGAEMWVVHGGE